MAKRRPAKLNVGCFTYELLWQKCSDKANIGLCEPDQLKITIDPSTPFMVQANVLVHELLHAGANFVGLSATADIEEGIVTKMSAIVVSMLRDNPDVVEFITRKTE